jgi:hypothetical protein
MAHFTRSPHFKRAHFALACATAISALVVANDARQDAQQSALTFATLSQTTLSQSALSKPESVKRRPAKRRLCR